MAEVTAPIRVGVIGLGNSGWFYHAEASIEPSSSCELVAVCAEEPDRVAKAERRFGVRGFGRWEDLVAEPDVEVVVVALPHHLHHRVTIRAMEEGKHVVVEKPMAIDSQQADEMIAVAERTGRQLSVFQQRRWEPDFRVIRAAVQEGRIGQLWGVRKTQSHQGHYRTASAVAPHASDVLDWARRASTGGGVGMLIGPHSVDHVLQLVPAGLRTVSGRAHRHRGDEAEHYLDLRLDFDDVVGQIEIFRRTAIAPTKWAIYGTEGTIVSQNGRVVAIHHFEAGTELIEDLKPLRGCVDFYERLARAIRAGGPLPVTAQEGRDAVRVLELGLASSRRDGEPIAFGPPAPSADPGST